MRKLVLRSIKDGKVDVELASKSIIQDAKSSVKGADISAFFSTRNLREVNGVTVIGKQPLFEFVTFTRIGDFELSFGRAFPDHAALKNLPIRNTINNLLLESRRTLPDFRVHRADQVISSASEVTGLNPKQLVNAGDLEKAVASNSKLSSATQQLMRRLVSTKTLKFVGWTAVIGTAGALTYQILYKKMEELAAENSGCFAYWYSANGELRKCKVQSLSCKSGDKTERPCLNGIIPTEVIENKDCLEDGNKEKNCLHCNIDDPLLAELPENVMVRCESKTAGDMLLEAISETVGNVWTGLGSAFSSLFLWGAILLVGIIVLIVVINFMR